MAEHTSSGFLDSAPISSEKENILVALRSK